jgi:putative OPT family oligopeptide transporter
MKRDILPLLFGLVITAVLSAVFVVAGLKAGTPGVSPLVILIAWGMFAKWLSASGHFGRFLNIAQVSGSAGMAVTAGVIFTAPLLQILIRNLKESGNPEYADLVIPPIDFWTLAEVCVAGALIGFGYVGITTKRFLTDPKLPAPEARACESMIEAAVTKPWQRPFLGRSLGLGVLAGLIAPLMIKLRTAVEAVGYTRTMNKELPGGGTESRSFVFDVHFSPIYIGIGGLLTLSTALLVFGGSLLRLIGDASLTLVPSGSQALLEYPSNSMRWVGGAAMAVAVAFSLVRFFQKPKATKEVFNENERDPSLLVIGGGRLFMLILSILAGFGILFYWLYRQEGALDPFVYYMAGSVLVLCMLMVALGAILSLQIGSSASPVSGTVFVTVLVLSFVALQLGRTSLDDIAILVPLLVGACVAVCAANDSSQDYKTMQLCGVPVRIGFLAQLLGLLVGAVAVPYALQIAAADPAILGTDALKAPQASLFADIIRGLLLDGDIPSNPILIGAGIGVLAVLAEIFAGRKGIQLPAMALAVGIYLPPYLGVGILIGAAFRYMGEGGRRQRPESILCAAGLITGAAFFELVFGSILAGEARIIEWLSLPKDWSLNGWLGGLFWAEGEVLTGKLLKGITMLAILGIGFLIFFNSAPNTRELPEDKDNDEGDDAGPGPDNTGPQSAPRSLRTPPSANRAEPDDLPQTQQLLERRREGSDDDETRQD